MTRFLPESVWIERSEVDTPLARSVLSRTRGRPVHVVEDPSVAEPADFTSGKRRLVLQRRRGGFLQACPGGTNGVVCCNYLVLNLISNCPLDCSYCFLQEYLANNPALKLFTNIEDALSELSTFLRAHPRRTFRIGTGELADSLALDPASGLSRFLAPLVVEHPNALLELKTKTDCIEDLLDLARNSDLWGRPTRGVGFGGPAPQSRVIVSWSVNAAQIAEADEQGGATMPERIAAARRVQEAGYRVGFHFDPLVDFEGWERAYGEAVEAIFAEVDPAAVAWVSLGTLRVTPALMEAVRRRGLARRILGSELVPAADGKRRIWYGLRRRMYQFLVDELRSIEPQLPIYLCMETPSLWGKVMKEVPSDRALGLRLAAGEAP